MLDYRKGGRSKKANYSTVVMRVPSPIKLEVAKLVEKFHLDNELYLSLPVDGEWWEVLGVSKESGDRDVKAAYKKLVKLYHPDVNPKRDAEARIAAVNAAYRSYKERLK